MKKIMTLFVVLLAMVPALADGQSRIQVIPDAPVVTYRRERAPERRPEPPVRLYGFGVNVLTQDNGVSFGSNLGRNEYAAMSGVLRQAATRLMQPEMDMSLRGWTGINSSIGSISMQLMSKKDFPETWEVPTRAIVFTVVGTYGRESEYSESRGHSGGILSRFLRKLGIHSPQRTYQDHAQGVARVFITDVSVTDVKTGKYIYTGFHFTPVEGGYSETARTRYEAEYRHSAVRNGTNRDLDPAYILAVAMDDAANQAQPQLNQIKQYLLVH